jgi:hypothetical protein
VDELLTVRRWRRYGADRLFVTHETGAPVGSVDLQSGEVVVENPALEDGVRRAAQAYLRSDVRTETGELVLPVPATPTDALDALDQAALEAWLGQVSRDTTELPVYRGERGSSVRTRLARLVDEGWQVLHDVPVGRQGNVLQNLLVGPGGILTVTERDLSGSHVVVEGRTMTVDGESVPYLRDARLEASRVQAALLAAACAGVVVRAVLVVQGQLDVRAPGGADDVLVVPRSELPSVFRLMAPRLGADRAAAIAAVAARRTTWSR